MVVYLYSVNIQGVNNNVAFLKACPKLIGIGGRPLRKGETKTILKENWVETISFLKRIERKNFWEIYEELRKQTKEFGLSCEYLYKGNVCLLAKNQLRSQEKIQEKIEHKVVRKKIYRHKDLVLRKAEKRDFGDYCEMGIFEVFRNSRSWKRELERKVKEKGKVGFLEVVNQFDDWRKEDEVWVNQVWEGKIRTIGRVKVENWEEGEKFWRRGEFGLREERELEWLWENLELDKVE